MAMCIVCNEREGTPGFNGNCTSQCNSMTQASIEALMVTEDTLLKARQITKRQAQLAISVGAIGTVPLSLVAQLDEVALENDGRTS